MRIAAAPIAGATSVLSNAPVGAHRPIIRATYDAGHEHPMPGSFGTLVRSEGEGPTGDVLVDTAHENAATVHRFLAEVLGRDSIDGAGMVIKSVVRFGAGEANAYWRDGAMWYGDGDGVKYRPLVFGLDVVAHEMTHGITEHEANLVYEDESGALNESFSDVLGEIVEQWSEQGAAFGTIAGAQRADWLIGEDVYTPDVGGDALRSLKAPGTANPEDPQPAHMRDFVVTTFDHGGVHYNSGIPNKAAYEAGIRIGSEKLAKVWYSALADHLGPNSSFVDAARATIAAATELYGSGVESRAVADAWTGVGVLTSAGFRASA